MQSQFLLAGGYNPTTLFPETELYACRLPDTVLVVINVGENSGNDAIAVTNKGKWCQ